MRDEPNRVRAPTVVSQVEPPTATRRGLRAPTDEPRKGSCRGRGETLVEAGHRRSQRFVLPDSCLVVEPRLGEAKLGLRPRFGTTSGFACSLSTGLGRGDGRCQLLIDEDRQQRRSIHTHNDGRSSQ